MFTTTDVVLSEHIDVPLSAEVRALFEPAAVAADKFGRGEIQPIHVLLALVQEETSRVAQVFQKAGIRPESLLETLRRRAR